MLGLPAKDGGRLGIMRENIGLQNVEILKKVNIMPESYGFYSWMMGTDHSKKRRVQQTL